MDYPADQFQQLLTVNTNGALFTAQAVGRQMVRFGNKGSIILVASLGGSNAVQVSGISHRTLKLLILYKDGLSWVAYSSSKAAVIQMARSLACELGPRGIRVNSLSPGYIISRQVRVCRLIASTYILFYRMTSTYLDAHPGLLQQWSALNPLGRIGRPDELRGVVTWLASDASSFCTGSECVIFRMNPCLN